MPLNPEQRRFVELQLDECDASLTDKPNLAAVFDQQWRADHRLKSLAAVSLFDITHPSSYFKPDNDLYFPADWQERLEEGAAILLPMLGVGEKNHFIARMRGNGCFSAEEELLLARGFATVFGAGAISFPKVIKGQAVPEFHVSIGERTIEVEAKGLNDQEGVRKLNEYSIRSGQFSWYSSSPSIANVSRLRSAVAKKLLSNVTGDARVLVLTQYSVWIHPAVAIPLIRTIATAPQTFSIPVEKHALAIAYVTSRWITGVWFNAGVAKRIGSDRGTCEKIRCAIRESFYPRKGGVFFDESMTEQREQQLIAVMQRIANGG